MRSRSWGEWGPRYSARQPTAQPSSRKAPRGETSVNCVRDRKALVLSHTKSKTFPAGAAGHRGARAAKLALRGGTVKKGDAPSLGISAA